MSTRTRAAVWLLRCRSRTQRKTGREQPASRCARAATHLSCRAERAFAARRSDGRASKRLFAHARARGNAMSGRRRTDPRSTERRCIHRRLKMCARAEERTRRRRHRRRPRAQPCARALCPQRELSELGFRRTARRSLCSRQGAGRCPALSQLGPVSRVPVTVECGDVNEPVAFVSFTIELAFGTLTGAHTDHVPASRVHRRRHEHAQRCARATASTRPTPHRHRQPPTLPLEAREVLPRASRPARHDPPRPRRPRPTASSATAT